MHSRVHVPILAALLALASCGKEGGGDSGLSAGDDGSGGTGATGTGEAGANCGNGMLDAGEDCDGSDLAGESCASLMQGSGTLACDMTCNFDMMMCTGGGSGGTTG